MLNPRAVAVVVDPVQSVKGKVVIDAFRCIDPQTILTQQEPRQTTAHIGHLQKPAIVAIAHGLGKYYYSMAINYRKNENEQKMLLNLNKVNWSSALKTQDYKEQQEKNEETMKDFAKLTGEYHKWILEENKQTREEFTVSSVGKLNPKNHLSSTIEDNMTTNVLECLGSMMNTIAF